MTTRPIEQPMRGDGVRASWGAGVAARVNECADAIDALRGPGALRSDRAAAAALAPFAVRLHRTEDDADGQWEIWLPPGCVSVGGDCAPLNRAASEKTGHADDRPGWYALDLEEEDGTFDIVARAKTSAKVHGVDELADPARRLLYVSADKAGEDPEAVWGDEFSQTVATVVIAAENGEVTARAVTPARTTPISVAGRARTNFDLVWHFGRDNDGALEVKKVYCLRQLMAVAGMSVTGDTMTEVTDAEEVYAWIDASNMVDGQGLVSVVADPANPTAGGDFVTRLPLYTLSGNAVVADYRDQSLKNVQLYRA